MITADGSGFCRPLFCLFGEIKGSGTAVMNSAVSDPLSVLRIRGSAMMILIPKQVQVAIAVKALCVSHSVFLQNSGMAIDK
jgi:hypothetical protein